MTQDAQIWLLGVCTANTGPGGAARLRIITSVRPRDGGGWLPDPAFALDKWGPSGQVNWPGAGAFAEALDGQILCFRAESTFHHGTKDPTKDWFRLARRGSDQWDLQTVIRLIQDSDARWDREPRRVRDVARGIPLYVQDARGRVIGPWRAGGWEEQDSEWQHLELTEHLVERFNDIDPQSILRTPTANNPGCRCLLFEPIGGEPLSLDSPEDLAQWFLRQLRATLPAGLAQLQAAHPDWMQQLQSAIKALPEAGDRRLGEARLHHISSLWDDLAGNRQWLDEVVTAEPFRQLWQRSLDRAATEWTNKRTSELEASAQQQAKQRIAEITEQGQKQVRAAEQQTQQQMTAVREKLGPLNDELAARKEELMGLEERLNSLTREGFRIVFEKLQGASSPVDPGPSPPAPATPTPLTGSAVADQKWFLRHRLGPALAQWAPFAREPILALFQATVLACRWTLVPDPGWARAYVEALGGTGRLTLVSVEATWLRFGEAWPGPLGEAWQRALAEPDRIHLICLRDLNRSLPQCWGRPLLDLLAGYRDELPAPASCRWPDNLRILACRAEDDASLPLSEEIIQHGAAIWQAVPAQGAQLPTEVKDAHITAKTWRQWANLPLASPVMDDAAAPLASLARAGSAELQRLRKALGLLGHDAARATLFASQIRIEWPRMYLSGGEHDPE